MKSSKSVYLHLVVLLVAVTGEGNVSNQQVEEEEGVANVISRRLGDEGAAAGLMVTHVVAEYLRGCLLLLVSTSQSSPMASYLTKHVHGGVHCADDGGGCGTEPSVVVEAGSLFSQGKTAQSHLLQALWRNTRMVCRALFLDLTNKTLATRFLKASGLWRQPETRVILVGGSYGVQDLLLHHSLRNTLHAICFVPDYASLQAGQRSSTRHLKKASSSQGGGGVWQKVRVYGRCLYCSHGQAALRVLLHRWSPTSGLSSHASLFSEHWEDLKGRRMRVTMLPYFPLSNHKKTSREDGSVLLAPRDSLDVRIINTIAVHLNFTYELVEPPDGQWGVVDDSGNWSGIVGMLQHERADFSFCLTTTSPRMRVMDHSRIYTHDPLVIISLKPQPLPQYLSIIRPLSGELWGILGLSIVGWGVITWLMLRVWSWFSGRMGVGLDYALLNSWGAMLNNPIANQGDNVVEQVLLGWWLLFCLIFTTAYRSSLVAHLTVQSRSAPINSFQDLLDQDHWAWGGLKSLRTGAYVQIFSKSPDPTLQKMYEMVQIHAVGEGLSRVLRGGYSFITGKYFIRSIIAMSYTDDRGYTPLYISKKEYSLLVGFIWGFRKGAPFVRSVSLVKQRLIEAGLIDYWTDDVMETRIRNDKKKRGENYAKAYVTTKDGDERQVVLGLSHLFNIFLLLLLGYCLALLVVLMEHLAYRCH